MAVPMERVELKLEAGVGLGLKISGGVDAPLTDPHLVACGIYATEVMPGGAAANAGMYEMDRIVAVGDTKTEQVTHEEAVALIKAETHKPHPRFTVERHADRETEAALALAAQPVQATPPPTVASAEKVFDELDTSGPGGFGCRLPQVVELISERGTNGMQRLYQRFGGPLGLAAKLKTDPAKGIAGTHEDIEERKHVFGANTTPDVNSKSLLQLMWEAFQDPILIVLMVAALVSLILGVTVEDNPETGWIEGVAILCSIIIVVMVTAVNDLQKEKQFKELQAQQNKSQLADVLRGGQLERVVYEEIVVGDVVLVAPGLVLPADGVLTTCNNVYTDESALTGESHDIKKSLEENPWMLSGTAVKQGTGTMIITCVGLFSEEGIIQKLITGVGADETERLETLAQVDLSEAERIVSNVDRRQQENFDALSEEDQDKLEKEEKKKAKKKDSVLQAKLERMALQIGYGATFFAILTIVVLVVRFSIEHFAIDKVAYKADVWGEYLEFLIVGITVLVVAIPEGLPLAVTISLAYSVKKMMKDNNLVRVLAACETMGNATTICSDKTGTLTKNRMTVTRSWVADTFFTKAADVGKLPAAVTEPLAQGIAYNSDRSSRYQINPEDGLPVQENNKTECACLQFADGFAPKTYEAYRDEMPDSDYVKVFPFDSANKRMQTVVQLPDGRFRMYVKGASELLLELCSAYQGADGELVPLTEDSTARIKEEVIVAFASEALRVICLAFRDFDTPQDWEDEDALMHNLVVSAFVGIQDPVRDEVPDAVISCQEAGVTVRMLTGDNLITARAIAINCNIIKPDDDFLVMEGPDFRRLVVKPDGTLNYEELNKIAPRLRVMARCSPADKYNLVKGLIKAGEVVAVTGDGTNDGPALSEADVGFAMGIAGTGVAREASDIIITDDNFSSIVKAISWGRNVYDAISKFLVFQLTVNVVAVIVAFLGACALKESPLRAVQLLWVNLIMDTFAALALATEAPTPELLKRKPYGRTQPLLSRTMLRQIIGHSIYQFAVMFTLVFAGEKIFDIPSGRRDDLTEAQRDEDKPSQHYTIVFNAFVWMQIFNEINARVIHDDMECSLGGCWLPGVVQAFLRPFRGFFNNPIFIGVIVGTAAAQAIIVEFGSKAISTAGLTGTQWGACIAFGVGSLVWNVVIHYIFPVSWIPKSFEGGAYADLTPDRVKELEEDDEADGTSHRSVEMPPGGLDASPPTGAKRDIRPASAAAPEEDDTRTSLGGLLWLRVGRRLRTQVRVAGAFRTAGNIARLRRRTSRLASHALGGPAARAPRRLSDHTVLQTQGLPAPSPARAMWRTAVARLRYQIRVVNAFRNVLPAAEARSMLTTSQPVTPLLEESGQQQQGGADMAGVERQPTNESIV